MVLSYQLVIHTIIKFVRIDEDNHPIPISNFVKERYKQRTEKYGKGLLTPEELEKER